MNETRTINLNGQVFHIDNDAYLALSSYLQDIELRLSADERKEVMSDLEARICELLQSALFAKNQQVVTIAMVEDLKQRIGAPSDFGENKRPKVRPQANNQGCGRALGIALKIFLIICALPVLFIVLIIAFSLILGLFGASVGVAAFLPEFLGSGWLTALVVIFLALVIILPIVMIIVPIVSYMRTRRGPKAHFWWIIVIAWLLSLGGLVWSGIEQCKAIEDPMGLLQRFEAMDENDWDEDDIFLQHETRTLAPFSAIQVSGAADITLQQTDSQCVEVRATDLTKVTTMVQDGILHIDIDAPRYTRAKLLLGIPQLTAIEAAGACELHCNTGFAADSLYITLAGASDAELHLTARTLSIDCAGASKLELTGQAEACQLELTGASKVDAEDFAVQDMHISCTGASVADIQAQRTLWAQAVGASNIEYAGNPKIEQNMAIGGSRIERE